MNNLGAAGINTVFIPGGPDAARTAGGAPLCGEDPAGSEVSSRPALAGRRREAPALDLSLGHFGTPIGDRVDGLVIDCGDFLLQVDHQLKTITVKVDPNDLALMDRSARRSIKRRAMKAVQKTAAVLGFTLEEARHG